MRTPHVYKAALYVVAAVAALILSAAAAGYCAETADPTQIVTANGTEVDIPLGGQLDASKSSLLVTTVVLGLMDGFNPCAFFVLFFLLSILMHARSKKRMLIIGGTFVFFSGAVYFMFMSAWLGLFVVLGNAVILTRAAGLVAIVVAAINIKDFFWFKRGVTLGIPESAKKGIFERMRVLLKSASTVSMVAGAAVLALAANSYELLCTAGFPMVYTRALTLRGLNWAGYYGWLALYNVVYVTPLAAIVVAFSLTLGARKLTEWHGRQLKLTSGTMMLGMGVSLVAFPALLTNAVYALLLFAGSMGLTGITVALYRHYSPGCGFDR